MPEEETKPYEEYEIKGALIKIMPSLADQNLFRKLSVQIQEDYKVVEQLLEALGSEIKHQPAEVSTLVHSLLRNYTGTALGYIIDPLHSKSIIVDRITQICEIIMLITERRIMRLLDKVRKGQLAPNDDISREINNIIRLHEISMIAIREVTNRLITLARINAPAPYRPPLANVKMGFDLM